MAGFSVGDQTLEKIAQMVRQFEDCTLPQDQWTHSAHLTVALWYLTHCPIGEATNRIRNGIQTYNRALGIVQTKTGGYHETITLFYLHAIADYLRGAAHDTPFAELAQGLIAVWGDKRLLGRYYSRGLLMSAEARQNRVEPDRQPLTFTEPLDRSNPDAEGLHPGDQSLYQS